MDADGAGKVGEGEGAMWIRKGSYHVCTSNGVLILHTTLCAPPAAEIEF